MVAKTPRLLTAEQRDAFVRIPPNLSERVRVAVNAANADRNAAYFGPGRGATIYGHTADFRLPFHTQVISTNDREALYVIDGL